MHVVADELSRGLNQMSQLTSQNNDIARLRWADDTLTISAAATDVGSAEVRLPAVIEGGEGEIAFNSRQLLDYLKGKTETVEIATVAGEPEEFRGKPVVLSHRGSPMLIQMPMMVQASEVEPPEESVEVDPPAADPKGTGGESAESPPEETQAAPRRSRKGGAAAG